MPETPFQFDGTHRTAEAAAARQAAALVTHVSAGTVAALRALIARSIREGIPPYEAARMIRSMVGMTTRQAMAAMNFRESLINSGLTLGRVDTLVARFVKRKIRERAINIARTETLSALNRGVQESWRQARREGLLTKTAAKTWITTLDERLCPICAPLEGQIVGFDQSFQTSVGELLHPPAHPQCRCAMGIVEAGPGTRAA